MLLVLYIIYIELLKKKLKKQKFKRIWKNKKNVHLDHRVMLKRIMKNGWKIVK